VEYFKKTRGHNGMGNKEGAGKDGNNLSFAVFKIMLFSTIFFVIEE
jgi:hypothetical protein